MWITINSVQSQASTAVHICGVWCNCPIENIRQASEQLRREAERLRRDVALIFGRDDEEAEEFERQRALVRLFAWRAYAALVRQRRRHLNALQCPAAHPRAAVPLRLRRDARGQPLGLRNFSRR